MKALPKAARFWTASPRGGRPSCRASRACWKPARRWRSRSPRSTSRAWNEHRRFQTDDGLHHLYRVDTGAGVGSADLGRIHPEIFFRQCGRGRAESRRRVYRAHAGRRAAYLRRGDRMRSSSQAHRHLQRQLAGADRKTRADPRQLRDRTGRRCRPAHHDRVTRPAAQRRYPLRRPPGLARNPVEPEEPIGNRSAAGYQDGPAAAHAGGTEGVGDRDAVGSRRGAYPSPSWAGLSHVVEEIEKESIVPARAFDFLAHGYWVGMRANDVERESSQDRQVLRAIVFSGSVAIL